jgi:hypothetical protein
VAVPGDARLRGADLLLLHLRPPEHLARPGVFRAASGLSNDEIARKLVVSPLTAKTHVSRAMTKQNARAQLVVLAYEHGLTPS